MTCINHRARHFELAHLGKEDHDGQTVHKPQHNRVRHQPHELAPLHDTRENLDQPHQHDRGEQIFNTVLRDQCDHHNRQSTRRPRDHPRTPADQRGDQPHEEGRIETHQRVDPRDEGKGNRFGHKGQGDGQPRQQFDAQPRRREPLSGHPS